MKLEKFNEEITTLKSFFEIYCEKKHENQIFKTILLNYKDQNIKIELCLCDKCIETINYSFSSLQNCPHEDKPRCRKCPKPCYEKKQWKEVARIMRYSGVFMGLINVNKKIKNLFKAT